MKWLSNRYAYPLVALAILAIVGLQAAWLIQLFRAQQIQVKRDLDQAVSNAARKSDYLSVRKGHEKSENFRNFFLSAEWLQFKQAYTRMRYRHIASRYNSQIKDDSTIVDISLRIPNDKYIPGKRKILRTYDDGETLMSIMADDRIDLRRMDSLVRLELKQNGINAKSFYILYNYETGKPASLTVAKKAKIAAYRSQQFGYNLHFFLHTYQLVVPSINEVVVYRMRYYLVSSVLMLVLTGLAFVFLFRMMRSQRLYTQARIAFTGNMTHELKTPVAVIEAALDAITRYELKRDPIKLENYLDISKTEVQRLNLIIDKVLNLDQLDSGEIRLRTELYDVQQGMESVVSSMRLRNDHKGASIKYFPAEEPCFVDGDPVHLTNVFYNLVDNALKYSGAKAVIIIDCQVEKNMVRVSIKDNGPGIPKIYHDRIFERFFRIPGHTDQHNVKGSGLGLHYVKQIIGQHGGRVEVQSEPGNGSNFIIYLPSYNEI